MNMTVFIIISITVVGLAAILTDRPIFSHFLQIGLSFGIQILPVTRFLKRSDNVDYAWRKVDQYFNRMIED